MLETIVNLQSEGRYEDAVRYMASLQDRLISFSNILDSNHQDTGGFFSLSFFLFLKGSYVFSLSLLLSVVVYKGKKMPTTS